MQLCSSPTGNVFQLLPRRTAAFLAGHSERALAVQGSAVASCTEELDAEAVFLDELTNTLVLRFRRRATGRPMELRARLAAGASGGAALSTRQMAVRAPPRIVEGAPRSVAASFADLGAASRQSLLLPPSAQFGASSSVEGAMYCVLLALVFWLLLILLLLSQGEDWLGSVWLDYGNEEPP